MGAKYRYRIAGAVVAGAIILTGCGAPSFDYVADSADQAYFKVPPTWKEIGQQGLTNFQASLGNLPFGPVSGTVVWSRGYDAASKPSATHVLAVTGEPVVYASVQDLNSTAQAAMSYDAMRNLVLPVTTVARKAAAKAGSRLSGFHLLGDSLVSQPGGIRGVHVRFGYAGPGNVPEIFDQTVLTNSDTTKLYLLLVQCDEKCFAKNVQQINEVVSSFTVRGS